MNTNEARDKATGTPRGKRPLTYKEFLSYEIPTPPMANKDEIWPRVRLTKDVGAFAQYLAAVSRTNMRDVVLRALEFAFENIEFRSVEVYDVDFVNRGSGTFSVAGEKTEGSSE